MRPRPTMQDCLSKMFPHSSQQRSFVARQQQCKRSQTVQQSHPKPARKQISMLRGSGKLLRGRTGLALSNLLTSASGDLRAPSTDSPRGGLSEMRLQFEDPCMHDAQAQHASSTNESYRQTKYKQTRCADWLDHMLSWQLHASMPEQVPWVLA